MKEHNLINNPNIVAWISDLVRFTDYTDQEIVEQMVLKLVLDKTEALSLLNEIAPLEEG